MGRVGDLIENVRAIERNEILNGVPEEDEIWNAVKGMKELVGGDSLRVAQGETLPTGREAKCPPANGGKDRGANEKRLP